MRATGTFVDKMRAGKICIGTGITFTDATVSEILAPAFDFLWIDMEHNALSLETVQAHLIAAKGVDCTPIVRVPWNDPVLIKPVLDIGAPGIVVPLVRTVDETRSAVKACLYPPDGVRGFGPRRASNYGRLGGPEFCRAANETMIVVVQIEHIDAVHDLDAILAVPGVSAVMIGANDLSGSMGLMGQPRHPDVMRAVDTIIEKSRRAGIPVGTATGSSPEHIADWVDKGMQWIMVGTDYLLMLERADWVASLVRAGSPAATGPNG
jgi:2-keto-3-deoxy-L-rhamnonate aldolase RhmA